METNIFETLWKSYEGITPSAKIIQNIFSANGNEVLNDHIAFRTVNDPRVNVQKLANYFEQIGYVQKGTYVFPEKKLDAIHLEHPTEEKAPKIFISELKLEEMSTTTQAIIKSFLDEVNFDNFSPISFLTSGRAWSMPSYETFQKLQEESEYAAWLYVFGFRANHFTVFVNHLDGFNSLKEVNDLLESKGFKLNASGGKIKGSKEQYLEQSSTLADKALIDFEEGRFEVPSCYYEFAFRHDLPNGELFQGFIAASADKIFESNYMSLQS